ncbi:MAG TPA: VOC family protein [bacterium]|nr:VOC family protein [bacterium]
MSVSAISRREEQMIDHVVLYVSDLGRSRRFYEQALEPVGYGIVFEMEGLVAFGSEGQTRFAVRSGKEPNTTAHVAFQAEDRATVDAFHAAAMAAGGMDEGPPGVRENYGPTYYAAFVGDPDGNNVESVCRKPA